MTAAAGIGLAVVAMLSWGYGDFLIQRSTKTLGDWETLFVITAFGSFALLPFVYRSLPALIYSSGSNLLILLGAALFLTTAALMHFEAFKKGKLSVLEPLLAIELITATISSYFVLADHITFLQCITVLLLMVFLFLVSFREKAISKSFLMEKGVILFIFASIFMGVADFFLGWGSRTTDPILANFVINVIMMAISGIAIVARGRSHHLVVDVKENSGATLVMVIADNVAWIAYAFAMTIVPIAIATGLSEASIIVAVLLGLFVVKEKLQQHQKIGLVGAIICTIALAVLTAQ